jgi:hypothetical protein
MAKNTKNYGSSHPKRTGIGDVMNNLPTLFWGGSVVGIPNQKKPKGNGNKNLQEFFKGFAQN